MKRLLLAAAALAVALPGAALAAPGRDHDRSYDQRYETPRYDPYAYDERYGTYGDRYERRDDRRWERGRHVWRQWEYLPGELRRWRIDPREYGLWRPRDRNIAWYRVGDQLVLANIHNGLIAEARWR